MNHPQGFEVLTLDIDVNRFKLFHTTIVRDIYRPTQYEVAIFAKVNKLKSPLWQRSNVHNVSDKSKMNLLSFLTHLHVLSFCMSLISFT